MTYIFFVYRNVTLEENLSAFFFNARQENPRFGDSQRQRNRGNCPQLHCVLKLVRSAIYPEESVGIQFLLPIPAIGDQSAAPRRGYAVVQAGNIRSQ